MKASFLYKNIFADILDFPILKSTYFFCQRLFTFENSEKLKHVQHRQVIKNI
jgi:hypothetical protein